MKEVTTTAWHIVKDEWTLCAKEQPEHYKWVVITTFKKEVDIAKLRIDEGKNDYWETLIGDYLLEAEDVEAWCPIYLPAPYEEATECD